ncbi:MAG: PAS domain-containing protein [Candidatus Aenigmarchaeota archaeon]|nr:PAS domain-containing protein [Candidatus Aenigmarchaeota archaeon]
MEHENKGFEEDLIDLESYIEDFSLFLPLAVCILSPNSIIININKAFSRLTHYNETEIVGKHIECMFKDKELWKALENKIAEEKRIEKEESLLISKKGEEIPINVFLSRREDKEGNFIGYFLGIDDITERKKAEYEIKESEEKYRLLAENSYDGILTTDRKGIITYASPALERMFDIPSSVSVGMHFSKYVTKKSSLKGIKLFMDLVIGKTNFYENIEFEAVHKDGRTFPIEVSASSLIKDGKAVGMVGIIRDITERKKLNSALEAASEFSENILNSMIDGVTVVDLNGELKKVNEVTMKYTGYAKEELIGMNGAKLISEEDVPKMEALLKEVLKKGAVSNITLNMLAKNKQRLPMNVNLVLLKDTEDKPIGILSVARDISQIDKLINELQNAKNFSEGVLNTMADGLIIMNPQAEVVRINKAEEQLMGYKQDELKGDIAFKIGKPEDIEKQMKMLQEAVEKGRSGPIELTSITKDGREIPVSTTFSTLKDERGKVTAVFTVSRDITGQKKAQEAIRESEEKLRSIFESVSDGFVYTDINGNVLEVNKIIEKMLGYNKEEIRGKNFAELGVVEPKDLPNILKIMADTTTGGKLIKNFELTLITKDGKKISTEITTDVIKKEGKIIGLTAIIRDITERKKTQEALIESEEKLSFIFDAALDCIVYTDNYGTLLTINKAGEKITGYKKEELIGKNFAELQIIDPENIPHLLELLSKTEGIRGMEIEVIRKDGTKVPVEVSSNIIRKGDKVIGHSAIIRDITERKKAQEAIMESEEKLRAVFDAAEDGIVYIDTSGNLVAFNNRLAEILGYKNEDISGKNFLDLGVIDTKDLPYFSGLMSNVITKGTIIKTLEMDLIRKDGRRVPIEATTSAIEKNGKFVGFSAIIRDVSERKKTQEAIQESEEKLSSIFEASRDTIVYLDASGKVIAVNKMIEEMLGFKKEELIGKNFTDTRLIDPKALPHLLDLMNKGESVKNLELELIRKDGKRITTDIAATYIRKEGKIFGFLASIRDITERKREQEEIRESEEKLRSVFDTADDGIVYIDLYGNVLTANKTALDLCGYKKDDIIGKNFAELGVIDPNELPGLLKMTADTMATGRRIKNLEVTMIKKDGKRVPTEISSSVITKEGRIIGLTAIIRDIAERKKAQEAIRESEEKIKTIFDSANDAIVYVDTTGTPVEFNKRFEEITGYNREEAIGKNFIELEIIDPKNIETFSKFLSAGQVIKDLQLELIRKDKSRVLTEVNARAIKKEDKLIGYSVVLRDITERKKAQEAITESEEKLKAIFDSVDDAVVYLDGAGNLIAFNKKLEEMFGYKSEELIGKNFAELGMLDTSDLQLFMGQVQEITSTGKTTKEKHLEIELIRKNGTRVPVEINSNIIKKEGKPIGFAAVIRDITQRKRIHEEEKNRTDELERFTRLAVGRELKMIELKNMLRELEEKLKEKEMIKGV